MEYDTDFCVSIEQEEEYDPVQISIVHIDAERLVEIDNPCDQSSWFTAENARRVAAALSAAADRIDGTAPVPATGLHALGERAFALALEKGFHAHDETFVGYHRAPERVASRIALIHAELSEALEEVARHRPHRYEGENGKPEGLAIDLADVILRTVDLAHSLGIDLDRAVADKHAYNITRPIRHGGKAL